MMVIKPEKNISLGNTTHFFSGSFDVLLDKMEKMPSKVVNSENLISNF